MDFGFCLERDRMYCSSDGGVGVRESPSGCGAAAVIGKTHGFLNLRGLP